MFSQAAKTIHRMRPNLQRVLVVDPQPRAARLLSELLRQVAVPEIWVAETNGKALELAAEVDPQVVFCELAGETVDGVALTRSVRRGVLDCRKAPVILTTQQATAAAILAARDAGAHEFLRKPFTSKDLLRRLEAVTLHPREWVEAVDYVGPDRRRFNSAEYPGPLKRAADQPGTSESVRIGQALKILRSALAAVASDPVQALRALLAQTTELQVAAAMASDNRLAMATNDLHRYLFETASAGAILDRAETERRAAALLGFIAREDRAAA